MEKCVPRKEVPGPSPGSPRLQVEHREEKAKEAEGMGSQGRTKIGNVTVTRADPVSGE